MNEHERRRHDDKNLMKEAYKEASKEIISEYITKFGWFSVKTIAVLLVVALLYFVLSMNGWRHDPSAHTPPNAERNEK